MPTHRPFNANRPQSVGVLLWYVTHAPLARCAPHAVHCLCSQPIPKAAGRVRLFIQLSEPTPGEWVGFLMLSSTCSSPKSKGCIPLSSRGRRPPELVWWAVLCYSRRVTRAFQCPQSPSVWNGAGGNPLCCACPACFFVSRLRRPGFGASAFTGTLVAGRTSGLESAVDTPGFPIAGSCCPDRTVLAATRTCSTGSPSPAVSFSSASACFQSWFTPVRSLRCRQEGGVKVNARFVR